MSLDFKSETIYYIDDTRSLNYLECMGLIQDSIMFNKIYPINPSNKDNQADIGMFKSIIKKGKVDSYTYKCCPEDKTTVIEFKSNYNNYCYNYFIRFIPCHTKLILDFINNNCEIFATSNYDVENLMDMFI